MIFGSYVRGSDDETDVFIVTVTNQQQHEITLDLNINGEIIHTTNEHPLLGKVVASDGIVALRCVNMLESADKFGLFGRMPPILEPHTV